MSHARHEAPTTVVDEVNAVLAALPEFIGVAPWADAFVATPSPAPEPVVGPPAEVEPLVELAPLVEVEPLVALTPTAVPQPEPEAAPGPEPGPRLYVASSWDSLGAPPADPGAEPAVVPTPTLERRQASQVLSELGFLDD